MSVVGKIHGLWMLWRDRAADPGPLDPDDCVHVGVGQTVLTRPCRSCGAPCQIKVSTLDWVSWRGGLPAVDAFPYLSTAQLEQLLTSRHQRGQCPRRLELHRAREVIADHAPEGDPSVCRICRTAWPCMTTVKASNVLENLGEI